MSADTKAGWSTFCRRGDTRACVELGARCANPAHAKKSAPTVARSSRRTAPAPAPRPTPARPDRQPRHGTASEYSNHRCRCDDCRAAWRAWSRDYYRRRHNSPGRQPRGTNWTHGIRATYVKGCRCEDCTAAERTYKADLRARRRRSGLAVAA